MKTYSNTFQGITINIVIVLLFLVPRSIHSGEKLYIFFPTTTRPSVISQKIKNICPEIETTIFDNHQQLMARISANPPDAVIAQPLLFNQLSNYSIRLNGYYRGSGGESYVLLSVLDSIDVKSIDAQTKIGVIDFLGRAGMVAFLKQFFTVSPVLIRVTKLEDLLPLLQFKMAKAIMIPKMHIDFITRNSNLALVSTPLPEKKIGIVSLALKQDGTAEKIMNCIAKMKGASSILAEVDEWK